MYWVRHIGHSAGTPSSQLNDATEAIVQGLKMLGLPVSLTGGTRQIIIGGNCDIEGAQRRDGVIPDGSVVYNLEQAGNYHFSPEYIELLRRCEVWDYNQVNSARLIELYGVNAPKYVPYGWVPTQRRVRFDGPDDWYDVCFLGALSAPRRAIIDRLRELGHEVFSSNICYGVARDQAVSKSKILLNLHFHPQKIMESLRLGLGMAFSRAVVSQCDPDTAVDPELVKGVMAVPYDRVVDAVRYLLHQHHRRDAQADLGHETFKARRMDKVLERVL